MSEQSRLQISTARNIAAHQGVANAQKAVGLELMLKLVPTAHPSSKRTWSFPFPVAPWETASAPTCCAISIWRLAISGRAMEVPSM